jgi:hypothetical protein
VPREVPEAGEMDGARLLTSIRRIGLAPIFLVDLISSERLFPARSRWVHGLSMGAVV